ncbi:DsbA family protein [Actinoplanes derwentensis]|uniref:Protein-disulfide isomerase n=1 Tax=Actinoplanes derwentensis TaxID=113562 RepID=A0A1H2CFL2_9ACTN|nr:thioredoxin domain-containing protein [Actinoplanes derwentensis]GID86100.1 membrane protein [Actinoplanes derwentensis]SDT69241.1 Protein-disulfide isomerase [Actinoplanes derwentensis]
MSKDNKKARQVIADQKAVERRRTVTLWTSVAVVLVLFVAGMIGWSRLAGTDEGTLVTPAAAVDDGTAFATGTGAVVVDVYEDFMCPICEQFETATGATLKELATADKITLRLHPVAILDGYSNGTEYSTRSAGAAAAAADAGKFTEFHDVLYANQPAENSAGLTDAKMIELAASVGLTSETFVKAVNEGTYKAWATKVTEMFSERGYNGTPTIVIDGERLTGPNDTVPSTELVTQTIEKAAG